MNKDKLIKLLLEKHNKTEEHLKDLSFKRSDKRYLRKAFQEGYKFALLEEQRLLETINEIYFNAPRVDKAFLDSMKVKG